MAPPTTPARAPEKMSSKTRTAIIALNVLTIALALAILGLTARHVAFIQNIFLAKRAFVDVQYGKYVEVNATTREWQTVTETISYLPRRFTMHDTYGLLAAGIICTISGAGALFMSLSRRDADVSLAFSGKTARKLTLPNLTTIRILNGISVIVLAVGTTIAWHEYRRTHPYILYQPVRRENIFHWNFESWNCALAPQISPDMTRVTPAMLEGLCQQAAATRYMVIPAFVFSLVAMALHFWAWRKHNIAVRENEAAPPYDEVAWKQADDESQSELGDARSPVSPVSPIAAPGYVAEMPARGVSRAELPMDAAIKEMMGEGWHKEMDAGFVGAEKSADETA